MQDPPLRGSRRGGRLAGSPARTADQQPFQLGGLGVVRLLLRQLRASRERTAKARKRKLPFTLGSDPGTMSPWCSLLVKAERPPDSRDVDIDPTFLGEEGHRYETTFNPP